MKILILIFLMLHFPFRQAHSSTIPYFTSELGEEYEVEFQAIFRTEWTDLNQLRGLTPADRTEYTNTYIMTTVKYLYGPLNNREYGNPQRDFKVNVNWQRAFIENGFVMLPYKYQAKWILHESLINRSSMTIPVPFTAGALETPNWFYCSDPDPQHRNMQLYWYYWDPIRPGCDHQMGREYLEVAVQLKNRTNNLEKSFPEYPRMFRQRQSGYHLNYTFAFGYVETPQNPLPSQDMDYGMQQFRDFVQYVRRNSGGVLTESPIYQKEFYGSINPQKIMGYRFQGIKSGVRLKIDVLASGDVDQMDIFAKSFAHDHDSFFGWFGHSRLGWGFDADIMAQKLNSQPRYYSISSLYQIVYWAGCNSYSYYTLPFFQLKTSTADPIGTKNLDIISNGLSSYFALNSINAQVILKHLINWERRASYQAIVLELENHAKRIGAERILINVMGDEDNPL